MEKKYDVIVLGLGGIGSAVADRLSRSGRAVLGLEQFGPVHDKGSSHGETRAIRKAYFEDERYVPLLVRAYELWRDLEFYSRTKLLFQTGCLIMGPKGSAVVQGCENSARRFSLNHEMLDSESLTKRYGFQTPKDTVAFFEPEGGYLLVEKCIEQFLNRARSNGADLKFNCKLASWKTTADGVEVCAGGETFRSKKLVLCLGPWISKNLNAERFPLSPKRTIQYWFQSENGSDLPVFFQDTNKGPWIYGFPRIGDTMKMAFHNVLSDCDADHVNRTVSAAEAESMEHFARSLLPALGKFSKAKTCMYTMTPDEHFLLGQLNRPNENVYICGGFSGHGFKFAPVIGEIIANLIAGTARHDISLFNPYRFK